MSHCQVWCMHQLHSVPIRIYPSLESMQVSDLPFGGWSSSSKHTTTRASFGLPLSEWVTFKRYGLSFYPTLETPHFFNLNPPLSLKLWNRSKVERREAICDEFNALIKNIIWEFVPNASNQNINFLEETIMNFYNQTKFGWKFCEGRFITKGFHQLPIVDYYETFNPIIKSQITQLVLSLSLALTHGWLILLGFVDASCPIMCVYLALGFINWRTLFSPLALLTLNLILYFLYW